MDPDPGFRDSPDEIVSSPERQQSTAPPEASERDGGARSSRSLESVPEGKPTHRWKKAKPPRAEGVSAPGPEVPSPYTDPRDYGYVFVLLGNLKEIVCDCWLGAAGASLDARHLSNFPRDAVEVTVRLGASGEGAREEGGGRMFTFEPWPVNRPKPYTVNLTRRHYGETDSYIAEIERYIRIAARECYRRWPVRKVRKNVCPLLATSLLGTGYGGNYRKTGDMVKRLLPLLYSLADELKVDIAIVTIEEEVFALTNSVKKQFLDFQCPDSPLYRTINGSRYLNDATLDKLRFLAAQAMCGELTLFVGAGASMGVGIPSWANLLNTIACKLGIEGEDFKEFSSLDYYTKAAVLESRLKKRNAALDAEGPAEGGTAATDERRQSKPRKKWGFGSYFDAADDFMNRLVPDATEGVRDAKADPAPRLTTIGQYVADETQSKYYSIVDATLASLPCKEIITTNYDDLLEKAWSYSGQFSVLPYKPVQGCKRWLLKMHGTITHPDEIVLSKRDYMRYHDRFAAMAGIVQSTLLTRHLLFVGFSLDDDNFQRIFDSVRKARHPAVDDTASADTADNLLHTQRRQLKMRDKATKYVGSKAQYPIYGVDDSDDEDTAGHKYSSVCGTALMLEHSPLKGEIWDGDIDLVCLQERSERTSCTDVGAEFDRLARLQEIFLDVLSSRCSQCGHIKFIFNDRYEDALTDGEKEFKACMKEFESSLRSLSQESKQTRAFQYFQKSMRKMGF